MIRFKVQGSRFKVGLLLAITAAPLFAQEPPAPEPPRAPEGSRIINLPSADVIGEGTLGVLFTHRFSTPLGEGDFHNFWTFGSDADTELGISYSPLAGLEISLDRFWVEDDYELAAKYQFTKRTTGHPFAVAIRVGGNGRTAQTVVGDRYAFFAQGIGSVTLFGSRVRLTAIPTYVSNTPFFRDVFNVPVALSVAITRTVNVQGEFYPKNEDFTERPASITSPARRTAAGWMVAIEKTVLRHRFAFTFGNLSAGTVDQYTASDFRGGLSKGDVFVGFNLVRQWKLK
jgi:hypothetical protein